MKRWIWILLVGLSALTVAVLAAPHSTLAKLPGGIASIFALQRMLDVWEERAPARQQRREDRREDRRIAALPKPPCGEKGWRSWMRCDLPEGHGGQHGTIVGTSYKNGPLTQSSSVTREMWT